MSSNQKVMPGTFAGDLRAALDEGLDPRFVAEKFECAVTTVTRWADGVAEPLPRTKEFVHRWIREWRSARAKSSTEHRVKTWPQYFQAALDGLKPFEVRTNDRNYNVGDVLVQEEWDPERIANVEDVPKGYTGRKFWQRITYVLAGSEAEKFGLQPGYCVLGVVKDHREQSKRAWEDWTAEDVRQELASWPEGETEDDLKKCVRCGMPESDTKAKVLFGGLCEICEPIVDDDLHTRECLEYAAKTRKSYCIVSCADARRARCGGRK